MSNGNSVIIREVKIECFDDDICQNRLIQITPKAFNLI